MRSLLQYLLCGAVLVVAAPSVTGQDKDRDPDDYRRFFKAPETPLEFWTALQFEIDVGRKDLAARHLRGLLTKKPTEADLLGIIDKDGILSILKLRNIRTWSPNKKEQDQALKDVEDLIAAATAAQKKRLGEPGRLRKLIRLLTATREERDYALRELYKSGSVAVPILIDSLLKAKEPADRLALKRALAQMGPSATAPLIAALDCDDADTKIDILEILRTKHVRQAKQIVPFLWYISASKTQPDAVRKKATQTLAYLLDIDPTRLTPAKVALTREAELYYQHKVTFGDPLHVRIWRWDGKEVVVGWPPKAESVPAAQAEEYYGLRFARQALNLDPAYRPAQEVFLSLAIDKAMARDLSKPLSVNSPEVNELLAKANPELVIEILDRAIKEKRTGVVLAAVQSLGSRAEVRAKKPTGRGEAALVRALYYPDPRVQMSAVEALLRIPGPPAPKTAARIVEILSRVLTPMATLSPGRKVLVAVWDEGWRRRVRQAVLDSGLEPVLAETGREAMRKLRSSSEIEAVLLDSTLPMPGLAPLLAQLRADVDVAKVPVLLAAVPETRAAHDHATRYAALKKRLDQLAADASRYTALLRAIDKDEAEEMKDVAKTKFITPDDRQIAVDRVHAKYEKRREEAKKADPAAARVAGEITKMEKEMAELARLYDLESEVRENSLARFVKRYDNVRVVHASLLTNPRALESSIIGDVREAGVALPAAEQQAASERAMRLLDSLAQGKPAGYDVKPAATNILDALDGGRLTAEGQLAAISACTRLPGARTQTVLAAVILDGMRTLPVRTAGVTALVEHIQRHSIQLTEIQFDRLRALAGQPGLDKKLKEQMDVLIGSLRPGDRTTGKRLREYNPTPGGVLPPPPKAVEK
jgi:hypothetical protein